jgi:fructose-bisphosphate aldolase class II
MAGEVRLDLLQELRIATRGVPLVLHGGSGVTPHDLRAAVLGGIRKVNIGTEIHAAFTRAIAGATGNDPRPALRAGRDAVAAVAEERIDLLGAAQRA